MEIYKIVGWLALVATIMYSCFGIPVQVYKNYKRKSTTGISLFMISFMSLTLFLWSLYAWVKTPKDWFIFSSNLPGLICTIILLFQFWYYRNS